MDTHAEIAQNFHALTFGSQHFEVDYYLSTKIFSQIAINCEKVNIAEAENLLEQLRAHDYDLVIIGTAHRHFNVFKEIIKRYNCAVIAHNLNFIKLSKLQLFSKVFVRDLPFRVKLLLKESLLSAPEVFSKARHLLVLDQNFADLNKFIHLPVFYSKFYHPSRASSEVRVVIPGAVSQRRRDYEGIFTKILSFSSGNSFEFIFLGKAAGKELKSLKALESKLPPNIEIKFFNQRVAADVFDEEMKKADVLWCPVQKETEFFSEKELYGSTKMSGNIGDAIKYNKLSIFPEWYKSEYALIKNEEDDVESQLVALKNLTVGFPLLLPENVRVQLNQVLEKLVNA